MNSFKKRPRLTQDSRYLIVDSRFSLAKMTRYLKLVSSDSTYDHFPACEVCEKHNYFFSCKISRTGDFAIADAFVRVEGNSESSVTLFGQFVTRF